MHLGYEIQHNSCIFQSDLLFIPGHWMMFSCACAGAAGIFSYPGHAFCLAGQSQLPGPPQCCPDIPGELTKTFHRGTEQSSFSVFLYYFFFFVKLLELLSCISFFALSYKYSKYHLNHSPIWLNFLLFWGHFSWFSQFWVILSVVYFLLYSETSMNYFLRYDPVFLYSHCFPRKISLFFLSALQVYFAFIP